MKTLKEPWATCGLKISTRDLTRLLPDAGLELPQRYVEIASEIGFPYFEDGMYFDVSWSRIDGQRMKTDEQENLVLELLLLVFSGAVTIEEMLGQIRHWSTRLGRPVLPSHYFPFARDAFTTHLLFDLSPERHGQIYAWPPILDPWGEEENKYIGFVADSLDDFLFNRLRDESTDDFVPGAG